MTDSLVDAGGSRLRLAAVDEMRAAFEKLVSYAQFSADYENVVRTKPRFVIGAPGEAIIPELGKVQPAFLSLLRKYIDAGRRWRGVAAR